MSSTNYRPEIDGLRAVAVVPVILFHGGVELFSGGYVGVDVFFVISGYLITSIILREQAEQRFSLLQFYERRARRILPALFLVTIVCVPFAVWLMTPPDLMDFAQSIIAVATFSSNFLFWSESGYWASASELKPLLHTWSLAVEEQFYLTFPLLLIVLNRHGRRWILVGCTAVTLLSLSLSLWSTPLYPSATFYLLPTRAWELGLGVLLACWLFRNPDAAKQTPGKVESWLSKTIHNLAGVLGLGMILTAVFWFDQATLFPGATALVPTLGTVLLIAFAAPDTWTGRLLQHPVFVALGLISYSAYLWHQPLFAFARYAGNGHIPLLLALALGLTSFGLAYLSWRFVEQPFRDRQKLPAATIFKLSGVGLALLIGIGMVGQWNQGFAARSPAVDAAEMAHRMRENRGLGAMCEDKFTLDSSCRTHDQPEILVWGDSYAMQIIPGILASNPDARIIQMTKSVCGPLEGIAPVIPPRYNRPWAEGCLKFSAQTLDWLSQQTSIRYVVLSSPFHQYLGPDLKILTAQGQVIDSTEATTKEAFKQTLAALRKMSLTPVIFSPPPANGLDLGRCLAQASWKGTPPGDCNFSRAELTRDRTRSSSFLNEFSDHYRVVRLDHLLCENDTCATYMGNQLMYRDAGHLSVEGSEYLGRQYDFYGLITGATDLPYAGI